MSRARIVNPYSARVLPEGSGTEPEKERRLDDDFPRMPKGYYAQTVNFWLREQRRRVEFEEGS